MQLALKIADTPIPLPSVIAPLSNNIHVGFFLGFFINILYVVGIFTALLYILHGGWRWIISSGDPKEVKNGREEIIYSLVGLAIIFVSMMLVNLLGAFLGIPLLGQ